MLCGFVNKDHDVHQDSGMDDDEIDSTIVPKENNDQEVPQGCGMDDDEIENDSIIVADEAKFKVNKVLQLSYYAVFSIYYHIHCLSVFLLQQTI